MGGQQTRFHHSLLAKSKGRESGGGETRKECISMNANTRKTADVSKSLSEMPKILMQCGAKVGE